MRKFVGGEEVSTQLSDSDVESRALKFAIDNRTRIAKEVVNTSIYNREDYPYTFFMAGSPGAGKTDISFQMVEFCKDKLSDLLDSSSAEKILIIDPDEIRELIPGYSGEDAHLYQRAVSKIIEKILDRAFEKSVSFLLDGTFSNITVADRNIGRAVARRRHVNVFYVYQDPALAWKAIQVRERYTGRSVPFDVYIQQLVSARSNVEEILKKYGGRVKLSIFISCEDCYETKLMATLDDLNCLLPDGCDVLSLKQRVLMAEVSVPL